MESADRSQRRKVIYVLKRSTILPPSRDNREAPFEAEAAASGLAALGLLSAKRVNTRFENNRTILSLGEKVQFCRKDFSFLEGRIDQPRPCEDPVDYVFDTPVNNGNTTGIVDIQLQKTVAVDGDSQTKVYFSSKWYSSGGNMRGFDIQQIADEHTEYYPSTPYEIGVVVHDAEQFISMANNATIGVDAARRKVSYIVDIHELQASLAHFRKICKSRTFTECDNGGASTPRELLKAKFNPQKQHLRLRFHQFLVVEKSLKALKRIAPTSATIDRNALLLACVCRSGKTFMLAGIIAELFQDPNFNSVLIVTPKPTETLKQWVDVFKNHADFQQAAILDDVTEVANVSLVTDGRPKPVIVVMSKQKLELAMKSDTYNACQFDVIAFDEAHFGGSTEPSKKTFEKHSKPTTQKIFLTATYIKPAMKWEIATDNIMTWSLDDNFLLKTQDWDGLAANHGEEHVHRALMQACGIEIKFGANAASSSTYAEDLNRAKNATTYIDDQPELRLLSLDVAVTEMCEKEGYSMAAVFKQYQKGNKEFLHRILEYVFGEGVYMHIDSRDNAPDNIVRRTLGTDFIAYLAFLPYSAGNKLDVSVKMFTAALAQTVSTYDIYDLSKQKDLANFVREKTQQARQSGKRGVVFVTGDKAGLGVSLPELDAVLMMNDNKSADQYFQRAFRCLTERAGKKSGCVVDFVPARMLNAVHQYGSSNAAWRSSQGDGPQAVLARLVGRSIRIQRGVLGTDSNISLIDVNGHEAWTILRESEVKQLTAAQSQVQYIRDNLVVTQQLEEVAFLFSIPESSKTAAWLPGEQSTPKLPTGLEGLYGGAANGSNASTPSLSTAPAAAETSPAATPNPTGQDTAEKAKAVRAFFSKLVPLLALISFPQDWSETCLKDAFEDLDEQEVDFLVSAFKWPVSQVDQIHNALVGVAQHADAMAVFQVVWEAVQFVLNNASGPVERAHQVCNYLRYLDLQDFLQPVSMQAASSVLEKLPELLWQRAQRGIKILDCCAGSPTLLAAAHEKLTSLLPESERHRVPSMLYAQHKELFALRLCKLVLPGIATLNLDLVESSKTFPMEGRPGEFEEFDCIISFPTHKKQNKKRVTSHEYVSVVLDLDIIQENGYAAFVLCCKWIAQKNLKDFRRDVMVPATFAIQPHIQRLDLLPERTQRASGEHVLLLGPPQASQNLVSCVEDPRSGYDDAVFVPVGFKNFVERLAMCMQAQGLESTGQRYFLGVKQNQLSRYLVAGPADGAPPEDWPPPGAIMYHRSKNKGPYANKCVLSKLPDSCKFPLEGYKVVTTQNAARNYGEPRGLNRSHTMVTNPNEVFSEAFVGWQFPTRHQAESFASYLKSGFVHNMVRLAKSDYTIDKSSLRWVPMLALSDSSPLAWTDEEILLAIDPEPAGLVALWRDLPVVTVENDDGVVNPPDVDAGGDDE